MKKPGVTPAFLFPTLPLSDANLGNTGTGTLERLRRQTVFLFA